MLGKIVIGRVPRPDGHFIGTKFLFVGGPFLPMQSMYIVKESVRRDTWAQTTTYAYEHFPMKLHWGSVVLGYLRVWLFYLAIAMPFILMYGEPISFSQFVARPETFVSYALLFVWLAVMTFPLMFRGNLSGDAARLAEITGVHVDPERLQESARGGLRVSCIQNSGVPVMTPEQVLRDGPGWGERERAYAWAAAYLLSLDAPAWGEVAKALRD